MKLTELSFSSLSEYLQYCPLKYYYRKIAQLEPEFIPCELVYGQGIHAALEAHFKAIMKGHSRSEGYLINLFRSAFDDPKIRYNGQKLDDLTDEASKLLNLAVTLETGEILGVEQAISVKVNGFKIIGYIDLLTRLDGKLTVWDWKTAKRRPNQADLDASLQFSTYNLAYQDADFKVVALLKQKKPAIEVYDTKRDYGQRRRTIKTYLRVKEAIEAGQWYPRESWWCGSCPYKTQCKKDF